MQSALFEVKLDSGDFHVLEKGLSYDQAKQLVAKVQAERADDIELQQHITSCMRSFGFSGSSCGNCGASIYAKMPRVNTGEMHRCASRDSNGFDVDGKSKDGAPDEWMRQGVDHCCSYCGSAHPEDVLTIMRERGFGAIEFTSKGYKWYINRPEVPNASFGAIKYYRWHDTPEFLEAFRGLTVLKSEVSVTVAPQVTVTIN